MTAEDRENYVYQFTFSVLDGMLQEWEGALPEDWDQRLSNVIMVACTAFDTIGTVLEARNEKKNKVIPLRPVE